MPGTHKTALATRTITAFFESVLKFQRSGVGGSSLPVLAPGLHVGMKKRNRMKTSYFIIVLLMLVIGSALQQACAPQEETATAKERIGVYDSRSIAVAFAGSPAHEAQMQQLMAEYNKARETGDADKVAVLEAEGKARQEKAHSQAFSTAPVDDILVHITDSLPEIMNNAGVTGLVSKWDDAELNKHVGAETVDVTMALVDAFKPNERQRKSAIEIQRHKPIPLEQAQKIQD